ncbi:hypothetical protein L2E82_12364 [Cichorium intybus]|uniref:Uncharacterized protein n=1 Tax=Cichorium intybus TaxID=13427 RepID=A0ACB9GHV2_CICIN|nr:hypothetical protein L2E82_12364 [Cichorium intybus]
MTALLSDPSDVKEGLLVHVGLKTVFPFLVRGGGCFSRETVIQTTSSPVFECRFGSTPSLTLDPFSSLLEGISKIAVTRGDNLLRVLFIRFKPLVLTTCAQADTWARRQAVRELCLRVS